MAMFRTIEKGFPINPNVQKMFVSVGEKSLETITLACGYVDLSVGITN